MSVQAFSVAGITLSFCWQTEIPRVDHASSECSENVIFEQRKINSRRVDRHENDAFSHAIRSQGNDSATRTISVDLTPRER